MKSSRLLVLCLVLGRQLAFAEPAPPMSQVEILTRTARRLAIEGKCSSLAVVTERVRELDAAHHAAELATDPVIAACTEGVDRRPVTARVEAMEPSDLEDPPPSMTTHYELPRPSPAVMQRHPIEPAAPPSCSGISPAFEPSIWSNSEQHSFRHVFALSFRDCDEHPAAISGQLAARLDLSSLGVMLGGEGEVMYAVGHGAKLGLVASLGGGTATQASVGLRLRNDYVWIGAELTSTTARLRHHEMEETDPSGIGMMFGIGLSGEAANAFGRAEAWALYGLARGIGALSLR